MGMKLAHKTLQEYQSALRSKKIKKGGIYFFQ